MSATQCTLGTVIFVNAGDGSYWLEDDLGDTDRRYVHQTYVNDKGQQCVSFVPVPLECVPPQFGDASVTYTVPSGCVLMSPTEFEARITAVGVQLMALCEYNSRYASDCSSLGQAIGQGNQESPRGKLLTPERKAALSDLNDRGNWAKHHNLGHDWRTHDNGVWVYRDCATALASSATDAGSPIYPLFKRCCEDAVLPFLL